MSSLDKVEVAVAAVIGTYDLPLAALLRLGRGARLQLETAGPEAVAILANGIAVGRGRLIEGRGGKLAVEIAEIFSRQAVSAPAPVGPAT